MSEEQLSTPGVVTSDQLLKPESASVAPKSRVPNVADARSIVQRLIQDSDSRQNFYKELQRVLDANRPWAPNKLREAGQAWRANFSSGEAAAIQEAAVSPHYDIYHSGKLYFFVRTNLGNDPDECEYRSQKISEVANRMVDEWPGFDQNNQNMINDRVYFGKGFLYWPEENDWHYRYVPQHQVLVPNKSSTMVEELSVLAILSDYKVDELWEKIREKSASDRGWNKEAVFKAFANATQVDPSSGIIPDVMDIQRQLNDHDINTGYSCDIIRCAHFFVREFDGKISQGLVTLDPLKKGQDEKGNPTYVDDWLFHRESQYGSWTEVIAPFFLKNSRGSWYGSTGLGKDIFGVIKARDRMYCKLWDLGFLDCGIWLQAQDAKSMNSLGMVQIGAFNIIPPGLAAQQAQIRGNLDAPIAMLDQSNALLQRNTGIYRQPLEGRQKGNPPTLGQVQMEYADRSQLSNTAVERAYRQLDVFYSELFRRLSKDSEFKKRLEKAAIPIECVQDDNLDSVKASRVMGNGSPMNRMTAIGATKDLVPLMPEKGKENWLKAAVAAFAGQTEVDLWVPVEGQERRPDDHENLAALENATLKVGHPVYVTGSQNDVIHLQEHFKAMAQAGQSLQMGGNPADVVNYMDRVGGHCGQHLQRLSTDETRQPAFKALMQQFKQLGQIADKLRGHVNNAIQGQQKQQQQAQQAAMDPMTQVKIQKEQLSMQMKQEKHQQLMRQKEEKFQQGKQLADAKTAADITRKRYSAFQPEAQ